MNKFRKLGLISYNGKIEVHNSLLSAVLHDKPEIKRSESSLHSITGAANTSLLRFFSALRFMVAVIFKSLQGSLPVSFKVLSKRALASVSLYLVGEGLFTSVQSDSHRSIRAAPAL
jgi:hypothetical protein